MLGAKYYFTGVPCVNGHVALRKTKGACVECIKLEWKAANKKRGEYFTAYNRQESVKEKKHERYQANRDKVIERAKTRPYHEVKEYKRAWKERNIQWVRADTKARRRKHRAATPPWLSRKQKAEIRNIYAIAITMSKTTGEQYVVDHIIPLRSDFVCGLHVPWNLRVITQEENLKKSNSFDSDA